MTEFEFAANRSSLLAVPHRFQCSIFSNPDLERMYAERAHSHKVEAEGASHALYISHAKEVAALIEEAADQSRVAHSD